MRNSWANIRWTKTKLMRKRCKWSAISGSKTSMGMMRKSEPGKRKNSVGNIDCNWMRSLRIRNCLLLQKRVRTNSLSPSTGLSRWNKTWRRRIGYSKAVKNPKLTQYSHTSERLTKILSCARWPGTVWKISNCDQKTMLRPWSPKELSLRNLSLGTWQKRAYLRTKAR